MTVSLSAGGAIILAGVCDIEDAETLVQLLLAHPDAEIDWRGCARAHTAVVQVLQAAGRPLQGPPEHRFLSQWVEPLLQGR